jgi:Tfp pilus assembly protein PilN
MSDGNLNLATRPFTNDAPVVRVAVLLGIAAVALLALNLSLYGSYFSGAGQDAREELEVVEQRIRDLEGDLAGLQAELSGYDLEAHNEQVEFLNQKIAERTFGWSRLFEDLDAVLPATVRLERMAPRIGSRSARRGRREVSLTLQGYARTEDGLLELIDALFAHERFEDPSPSRIATRDGQQQFNLSVVYLPEAGDRPAAPDAAAEEEE